MIATRGLGAGFGATLTTGGLGAGYGGTPPDAPDEVSAPNYWTSGWDVRLPDDEIIFLRRKTSSKAGV
jgi:hypothetical protein